MGVKKLVQDSSNPVRLFVDKDSAIFLLKVDGGCECIYMDSYVDSDFDKLKKLKGVKDVRFLGGAKFKDKISSLYLGWPEFAREIIAEDKIEVIFYPEGGKIRILRTELTNSEIQLDSTNFRCVKKRVLVIDDSKTIQKLLSKIIWKSDVLEVMATAGCPSEAREIIERERPDLITLDIHMPEMNGVEFLKSYLAEKNIPTIMVSSVAMSEGPLVMEALSNGALSYIQKPSLDKMDELSVEITNLLEAIAVSDVKKVNVDYSRDEDLSFDALEGLIGIGSSTGGPKALEDIFSLLPDNIPPIVVVQHIPSFFSKALAKRLNDQFKFTVKEAEDGDFIEENTIYIAPGEQQMKIIDVKGRRSIITNDDPPVNNFRPSVDYMFESLSAVGAGKMVVAILTGMGADGAKGLLKLRENGVFTIAQDEQSSVVFGMPKEAIKLGAASSILPLKDIAKKIVNEFNKR